MQYWYNNNGQQDGPYTLEQFKSLNLSESTLVFKTGESNWRKKIDFHELLIAAPSHVQTNSYENNNPISSLPLNNTFDPSYIHTPFSWWKWLLIASILPTIIGFVGFIDYDFEALIIGGFGLAYLVLLVAGIFGYILMYRNWKILQDGNPRTTPGKAVGFCFIPFFNIYWIFQAIHGLSIDQENYINQKGINSSIKPNKGVALATCICALIPYLGIIPAMVCGIITFVNQKNISLEILKNK